MTALLEQKELSGAEILKSAIMSHVVTKRDKKTGHLIIEGFASTSKVDHTDDVVTLSGLHSLANGLENQTTVLFNHDQNQPMGKLLARSVEELPDGSGEHGLKVKIQITRARPDLEEMFKDGTLNKFSWAGRLVRAYVQFSEKHGKELRYIEDVIPLEVSGVSIPANPSAAVTAAYIGKLLKFNGRSIMKTKELIDEKKSAPAEETKTQETAKTEEKVEEQKSAEMNLQSVTEFIKNLSDDEKSALASALIGEQTKDEEKSEETDEKSATEEAATETKESEGEEKSLDDIAESVKQTQEIAEQAMKKFEVEEEKKEQESIEVLKAQVATLSDTVKKLVGYIEKNTPVKETVVTEQVDKTGGSSSTKSDLERLLESDAYKSTDPMGQLRMVMQATRSGQ